MKPGIFLKYTCVKSVFVFFFYKYARMKPMLSNFKYACVEPVIFKLACVKRIPFEVNLCETYAFYVCLCENRDFLKVNP